MKKEYIKPTIQVVTINADDLCGNNYGINGGSGSGSYDDKVTTLSKGSSWEDEDDW